MNIPSTLLAAVAITVAGSATFASGCNPEWQLPSVTPACESDSTGCDVLQPVSGQDGFVGDFFVFASSPRAFLAQNGLPADTPADACFPDSDIKVKL